MSTSPHSSHQQSFSPCALSVPDMRLVVQSYLEVDEAYSEENVPRIIPKDVSHMYPLYVAYAIVAVRFSLSLLDHYIVAMLVEQEEVVDSPSASLGVFRWVTAPYISETVNRHRAKQQEHLGFQIHLLFSFMYTSGLCPPTLNSHILLHSSPCSSVVNSHS